MHRHQIGSGASHMARAVHATEAIGSLQAIASHMWCDQAAASLLAAFPGDAVGVAIGEVDRHGEVRDVEAVGAAGHGATEDQLNAIRRRFDSARRIGWVIGADAPARASRLIDLPSATGWATSDAGRRWEQAGASQLLVACEALRPNRPERVIVVEIGRPSAGVAFSAEDVALLNVVVGALRRRASVAFGPEPIGAARMLTGREQEVLSYLVLGMSVREIADRLSRSPHTVHDYVKSLHKKLEATSRGALVAKALGYEPAVSGEGERPRPRRRPRAGTPIPNGQR